MQDYLQRTAKSQAQLKNYRDTLSHQAQLLASAASAHDLSHVQTRADVMDRNWDLLQAVACPDPRLIKIAENVNSIASIRLQNLNTDIEGILSSSRSALDRLEHFYDSYTKIWIGSIREFEQDCSTSKSETVNSISNKIKELINKYRISRDSKLLAEIRVLQKTKCCLLLKQMIKGLKSLVACFKSFTKLLIINLRQSFRKILRFLFKNLDDVPDLKLFISVSN